MMANSLTCHCQNIPHLSMWCSLTVMLLMWWRKRINFIENATSSILHPRCDISREAFHYAIRLFARRISFITKWNIYVSMSRWHQSTKFVKVNVKFMYLNSCSTIIFPFETNHCQNLTLLLSKHLSNYAIPKTPNDLISLSLVKSLFAGQTTRAPEPWRCICLRGTFLCIIHKSHTIHFI